MTRRVGVTMRLTSAQGYVEPRDAISHDFCRALERCNARFTLIPNGLADPVRFFTDAGCDALLLTNGNDLADSPRDLTENALLAHAVAHRLPTLGVCRGLQLIVRFFGGRVSPGISAQPEVGSHVAIRHAVQLEGSMQRLFGASARTVNSFHDQGVLASDLPAELELTAQARGGVVEAIAHRELPIWAVQWHPERAADDPEGEARLLRHFLAGFREPPP
jgi:N5-(cytidine 5'-diphosphoramidyl)-L-glutamine hydrolase